MKLRISDDLVLGSDLVVSTADVFDETRCLHGEKKTYTKDELLNRMSAKTMKLEDGCWVWTGYVRNGYGSMSVNVRPAYLHHLSWRLHFGLIPNGKYVLHRCDNRRCWRPDCLFTGTQLDNVEDMWNKGRANPGLNACGAQGVDNINARHNAEVVEAARTLRASGLSQRAVAKRYGVSQSTVWRWVHEEVRSA